MTSEPNTQGRGVLNKLSYGEAPLQDPAAYSFSVYPLLTEKPGTPFVYLRSLKDGTSLTYPFSKNKLLKLEVLLVSSCNVYKHIKMSIYPYRVSFETF